MKKIICALATISLLSTPVLADKFEDDHKRLDELTQESDAFFDQYNGLHIFGKYDAEKDATVFHLNRNDLRKLIKNHKELKGLWSPQKDAECSQLDLSTAASGECHIRTMALSLANFFMDFQRTKRLLRSQGDYGIEAAKAISAAVKSHAKFTAQNCELHAASGYGGNGSGRVSFGCMLTETNKALKMLATVRNIINEPNSGYATNLRLQPRGLNEAIWNKSIAQQREWITSSTKYLTEAIDKYFPVNDEYSKSGNENAKKVLKESNDSYEEFMADYCKAYTHVFLKSFREDSKHGAVTRASCQVDLMNKRSSELSQLSYTDFATQ